MSRTIRRKKKGRCRSPFFRHAHRHLYQVEWFDREWKYVGLTDEQILGRKYHDYHGDHRPGMFSPPRAYVQLYHNRPYRYHERQALLRHLREDTLEALSNTPNPNSAGRGWW